MLSTTPRVVIGIDPSPEAYRLVALGPGGACAAVEIAVRPDGISRQEAAARAFAAVERQGLRRPASCVAIAPPQAMVTTVLELPPASSGAPIEQLAAAELSRGVGGAGLEIGVFPIESRKDGPTEYLVAGGLRDEILAIVEEHERLGIEIEAIDAPVCALARATGATNHLIVDLGRETLSLHVVRRGVPALSRSVQVGSAGGLGEAAVSEVDRCASYLASTLGDSGIEGIVLTGAEAECASVAQSIRDEFDVSVELWGSELGSSHGVQLGSSYAGAVGAAMWGHEGRAAA